MPIATVIYHLMHCENPTVWSHARALAAPGDHPTCASPSPQDHRPVVLLVDDEPDGLEILQWIFASEGFDVTTASSGAEALRRITQRAPDIVITDYMMAQMTGLALCQHLRQQSATAGIPIIMHTAAHTLPPDSRLYDRLVTKPSEAFDLVNGARMLLQQVR